MTIFRKHPEGVVVFLIHRETSDIRWAPTQEGEWRLVQDHSEFHELDSEVAKILPAKELLWIFEHCTCAHKTCGHCSKERIGVPELEEARTE